MQEVGVWWNVIDVPFGVDQAVLYYYGLLVGFRWLVEIS